MSDKDKPPLTGASTPEQLLPGDIDALEALARQLKAFEGSAGQSAQRIRELDNPCLWTGKASEGFREDMGELPKKLEKASSAFLSASTALFDCARKMRDLRTRCQNEVIPKASSAAAVTANWNAAKAEYDAAVARGEDKTMSLMKPAKSDPGDTMMDDAKDILKKLRDDWNDAEDDAAKILKDKADDAPKGGDKVLDAFKDFLGGAWDATLDLASTAYNLSPIRAAIDPEGYYTDLSAMKQGIVFAATNPVDFAKAAVSWDEWLKNPFRAAGMLVPDLVLTTATGGAGKVPSTVTKLDDVVPGKTPDLPGGKPDPNKPGEPKPGEPKPDEPDPNACPADRGPDARECVGEPIDVATGEMVLAQSDASLVGALPLLLTRQHRTHYTHGRWFGRRWASTLDQHLELGPDGVLFLGADGVELRYPVPEPESAVLPVGGHRWPLRWDGRPGGEFTVTDPHRGWTWTFAPLTDVQPHFGPDGPALPVRALTDRNGNRIDYLYDAEGMPYEVTHSGGYRIAVDTADDHITAFRLLNADPESHRRTEDPAASVPLVHFTYDDPGNVTEVINSSDRPLVFTYDDDHRITSWTDRNGTWYRYTYDTAGRCIHGVGPDGILDNTFEYDTDAQITRMTDALGAVREFAWDRWGRVTRQTDPLGNTTHTAWDAYNRKTHVTDPLGHRTFFTYDGAGNLTGILYPDGTYSLADFDPAVCRPTRVINPDGTRRHYTWDACGNLQSARDELDAETRHTHDEHGNITTVTNALGAVTRIASDRTGLPSAVTNPLGHTTTAVRDAFGRLAAVTDPLAHTTRTAWTVEGKPARRELADGTTESWTWDAEGNLLHHHNAAGFTTRYASGPFDQPAAQTDPDGNRHSFTYDAELRLTTVTNPQDLTWTYTYDPAGRLVSETDFNGRTLTYTRNAAGHLISRTNGGGEEVTYTRDPFGNIIRSVHTATGRANTYTHDAMGRLVQATNPDVDLTLTRDPAGRVTAETSNGHTLTSTYDTLGRRVRRETPSGHISSWMYDAAGQPTRLETAGHTLDFAYDAAGRETTRHFGDQVTFTQEWDTADRLTTQSLAVGPRPDKITQVLTPDLPGPAETHRRTYTWRPDGYLTATHDTTTGRKTFDLDPTGRVTAVHAKGWTERYAYDSLGNITHAEWPTTPDTNAEDTQGPRRFTGTLIRHAGRTTYEHDAQGRIIRRARRTLSGKTKVWTYIWDAEDRLIGLTNPTGEHWCYLYDPFGRRTSKVCNPAVGSPAPTCVEFTWDGMRLVTQVGTETPTLSWEYAGNTWQPIVQVTNRATAETASDGTEFFAISHGRAGQPEILITPRGDIRHVGVNGIWGFETSVVESSRDLPLGFAGQYRDVESGLEYNFHRYYDAQFGGYISVDPLGLWGGPNQHGYVHNPTVWTDPLGLMSCGPEGTADT
ncbi:MAG: RHS repeat protein, partial [Streptomycetaceae bacterium]|nr:RHS repeat protein [Streptomycetaceae bacterium]